MQVYLRKKTNWASFCTTLFFTFFLLSFLGGRQVLWAQDVFSDPVSGTGESVTEESITGERVTEQSIDQGVSIDEESTIEKTRDNSYAPTSMERVGRGALGTGLIIAGIKGVEWQEQERRTRIEDCEDEKRKNGGSDSCDEDQNIAVLALGVATVALGGSFLITSVAPDENEEGEPTQFLSVEDKLVSWGLGIGSIVLGGQAILYSGTQSEEEQKCEEEKQSQGDQVKEGEEEEDCSQNSLMTFCFGVALAGYGVGSLMAGIFGPGVYQTALIPDIRSSKNVGFRFEVAYRY